MSQYWRVSFRSGVIASVVSRKISVQSPVECVMNSIGFAPSPAWKPSQSSLARGTRAARKTTGLKYRCIEKSGVRGSGARDQGSATTTAKDHEIESKPLILGL